MIVTFYISAIVPRISSPSITVPLVFVPSVTVLSPPHCSRSITILLISHPSFLDPLDSVQKPWGLCLSPQSLLTASPSPLEISPLSDSLSPLSLLLFFLPLTILFNIVNCTSDMVPSVAFSNSFCYCPHYPPLRTPSAFRPSICDHGFLLCPLRLYNMTPIGPDHLHCLSRLWALPFAGSLSSSVTSCFSFLSSLNHLLPLWVCVCVCVGRGWGGGRGLSVPLEPCFSTSVSGCFPSGFCPSTRILWGYALSQAFPGTEGPT